MNKYDYILIRIILIAALVALALSYRTHEKVAETNEKVEKVVLFIEGNNFIK